MAASHDPGQLSPKVTQPAIAAVIIFAVLAIAAAFLEAVGPDQLSGLGVWSGPISAAITAVVMVLRGYRALDPLRQDTANRIETLEMALKERDREIDQINYPDMRPEEIVEYRGKHEADEGPEYNPPNNLKG